MPSFRFEYDNQGDVQEFGFEGSSISVGRDKTSDFVLDHPTVSRQHAHVVHKHGGYHLVVVSRGGLTAVDGEQIQGEVPLYDGSTVHLGKLKFRFRSLDCPPKPASTTGAHTQQGLGGGASAGFGNATGGQQAPQSGFGGFPQPDSSASQPGNSGFGLGDSPSAGSASGFGLGDSPSAGSTASNFDAGPSSTGGFGSPPEAASQAQPEPPADHSEKDDDDAGIVSWDDIASSSEALEDGDDVPDQATVYERMKASKEKNKKDQTNPLLVIVAGAAIVGLVWYSFFYDPGGGGSSSVEDGPIQEQAPMVIEVSCMGEAACMREAQKAYNVGLEQLGKRDAAITNLFEGYKKLLQAEVYLEKAGRDKVPAEMAKLEAKKTEAREELTSLFRRSRVKYYNAKKKNQHRKMAQELDAIKVYFPDSTAREHRWAANQELDMKRKGIYPKHVYPER